MRFRLTADSPARCTPTAWTSGTFGAIRKSLVILASGYGDTQDQGPYDREIVIPSFFDVSLTERVARGNGSLLP